MKKNHQLVLVLSAVSVFTVGLTGNALAEVIQGKVVEVNQNADYLRINPMDQSAGLQKEVRLVVNNETKYKGKTRSIQDIKVGDEIKVDVDKKDTSNWKLKSVEGTNAASNSAQWNDNQSMSRDRSDMDSGHIPAKPDIASSSKNLNLKDPYSTEATQNARVGGANDAASTFQETGNDRAYSNNQGMNDHNSMNSTNR